jgi:hypothetical protein
MTVTPKFSHSTLRREGAPANNATCCFNIGLGLSNASAISCILILYVPGNNFQPRSFPGNLSHLLSSTCFFRHFLVVFAFDSAPWEWIRDRRSREACSGLQETSAVERLQLPFTSQISHLAFQPPGPRSISISKGRECEGDHSAYQDFICQSSDNHMLLLSDSLRCMFLLAEGEAENLPSDALAFPKHMQTTMVRPLSPLQLY